MSHSCLNLHLFYSFCEMNKNSFTKFLTQLLKMSDSKMNIFMFGSAKRTLQRVNLVDLKLFCKDSSSTDLLIMCINKTTIFERKSFKKFAY